MNTTQPITIERSEESSARCQHRTLKGRCRQLATESDATLCSQHARAQRQAKDDFTLLEPLVRKLEDLQTVDGISEDLAALHNLLAEGRISPRRASVFAYIDSLLLNTAREIEGRNLNYYGQPIKTYDWSSFPDFKGPDSPSSSVRSGELVSPSTTDGKFGAGAPDRGPARHEQSCLPKADSQ
jgi:hypothetical protein